MQTLYIGVPPVDLEVTHAPTKPSSKIKILKWFRTLMLNITYSSSSIIFLLSLLTILDLFKIN